MATKDKEKKKVLQAPTPTYTPIDPSLNSTYRVPTASVQSRIDSSQVDLTPRTQQQPVQQRQQISARGALSASQQQTENVDVKSPMSMTQTIYDIRNNGIQLTQKQSNQTPTAMLNNDPGLLMNKLTPDAKISPPIAVAPAEPSKWSTEYGKTIPVLGSVLTGLEKLTDITKPFGQGAAAVQGVPLQDQVPINSTLDKILYGAGTVAGGLMNPAALEQSLITGPYKAAQGVVSRVAPAVSNTAQRAATGTLSGAGTGALFPLLQGNPTAKDIAESAAIGGALGGVGDVVLPALGKIANTAISKLRAKNIPEETIARISQLPENEILRISELTPDEINIVLRDSNIPETPVIRRNQPEFQPETYLPEERIAERSGPTTTPTPVKSEPFPVSAKIKAKGVLTEVPDTVEPVASKQTGEPRVTNPTPPEVETVTVNREQPGRNERSFYSNVESSDIAPELGERLTTSPNREYTPITNQETVAKANERVANNLEEAISYARTGNKASAEQVATGYRAIQELQAQGRFQEAADLVDDLATKLTRAGQTIQAASLVGRLTPEGQLMHIQRKINKLNEKLPEGKQVKLDADTTQQITETAQAAQAARLSQERAADVLRISEKLRKGEELTQVERDTLSEFVDDLKTYVDDSVPDLSPSPQPDTRPAKRRKRDEIIKWLDAKEKAAQERLKAKKNAFNSNPFDTWVDMGIVAASKMAKGSIKFNDFSRQMISEFGEQVKPYLKRAFDQGKKVMKRTTNRINSAEASEAQKIAVKYLRDNGSTMSPADTDKIRDLASSISALQSGTKEQAEMELQRIINKYEKASIWDRVQALRYIAMLLNTGTQSVNALSGPIMASTGTVADLLPVFADKVISETLKKPRNITLYGTNPIRFVGQYFKNLKTGAKAGWQGVNPAGLTDQRDIGGLVYKSKANPLSWLERSLGAVAKGADYATYKTVYDAELKRAGWIDAKNKGIKGRDQVKRHVENYVANPTPESMEQADKIARNTTFQSNHRYGAKAANAINSMPAGIKHVGNTIMPFVKTPVNIAETALEMTPLGLIRGLYQLTSKSEASQREALRTLGMSLVGTGGLTVLGYELARAGILTGANDSGNKDVDKLRQQIGKGAYLFNSSAMSRYAKALLNGEGFEAAERAAKFQKGDKQFNYNKLQPLAFPAAIGASLQENSDKSVGQQVKNAGMDAYGSLFGMSSLKGLQDTFSSDYSGTTGEKAIAPVQRIIESFFKSFSPSLLAQEARRQDNTLRKTSFNNGIIQDVKEYYQSRTPFGVSESLPPNKTTLGQDRKNAEGVTGQYLNPYQSNTAQYNDAAAIIADLIDRTGDQSLAPSAPDKKVRGKDRVTGQQVVKTIPTERYSQLQQEVGDEIIKKIMAIPQEWSDTRKAETVTKIYTTVNDKYRNKVKKELGLRVSG